MTTKAKAIIGVVVAALVIVGGAAFWFLTDDAPSEVDLDTAAKSVTSTTTKGGATSSTAGSATTTATGIDGTWKIDTTSGAFDFESATGTFVGFRIEEELASIGAATAVGRTNAVTGSMTIADNAVTAADFTIDLTKITTNNSMRDRRVQDALETGTHPQATFTLTSPIELPANAADGGEIAATAKGTLTIHGVTKPVEFPMQAKLVNGTVVAVGSIDVTFSDFGVKVPSSQMVLSVADHGTLELQFLLTKG